MTDTRIFTRHRGSCLSLLVPLSVSPWTCFVLSSFLSSLSVFSFLKNKVSGIDKFSKLANHKKLITYLFLGFSGGLVGLAITQVMALTGMVQWGMRQAAEVTNQMMSVERVLEYTKVPPEENLRDKGPMEKKKKKNKEFKGSALLEPPEDWPANGCIEFRHVYLRYVDDEPPVLKGLTLSIQSFEKVRTLSNKYVFHIKFNVFYRLFNN